MLKNTIKKKGKIKGGSLCFYGHWFGKPYDNYHQLNNLEYDSSTNKLTLIFDERETLSISNPRNILEFENMVTIDIADNIYWQWYSYGKEYSNANLYYIEISKENNLLKGVSNVDWYKIAFKDLNIASPALLWI